MDPARREREAVLLILAMDTVTCNLSQICVCGERNDRAKGEREREEGERGETRDPRGQVGYSPVGYCPEGAQCLGMKIASKFNFG